MKRWIPVLVIIAAAVVIVAAIAGCNTIRPPSGSRTEQRTLITTGYCRCGRCCGWKRTWYGKPVFTSGPNKGKRKPVGITASGNPARHGTIAADTRIYPFGTVMHVPGYGYGRVEDRGGAIKGEKIDLYFTSHEKALQWGRRTKRVQVWYPED